MTKLMVIAGSPRLSGQTHRIGQVIAEKLAALDGVAAVDFLSLAETHLPLWSEEKGAAEKPADSFWAREWPTISERIAQADGFVIMTPEHHGMATPALKNLLFCCEAFELAWKPAYLVAVSAGVGGTWPVAELRISGFKNTYLHWLPDHLILRQAGDFRPGEAEHKAPGWVEARLDHGLRALGAYAAAVKPVRERVIDLDVIKTGM